MWLCTSKVLSSTFYIISYRFYDGFLEDNYYPLTEIESLYLRVDKFTLWCLTNFSLFVSQVKSTLSHSLWCGSVGSATFLLPGSGSGSDKNMWIHGPESKGKISTKYCKKNLLLSKFKFKLLKKERLLKSPYLWFIKLLHTNNRK